MIKIDNSYSISRDKYNWILHTTSEGKNVDGDPVDRVRKTFYATFPQVCKAILEREAGRCETVEELKNLFEQAVNRFEYLKEPTFTAPVDGPETEDYEGLI